MTADNYRTLQAAQRALDAGQYDQARTLFKKAALQDPDDYRPWVWLAGLEPTPQESTLNALAPRYTLTCTHGSCDENPTEGAKGSERGGDWGRCFRDVPP